MEIHDNVFGPITSSFRRSFWKHIACLVPLSLFVVLFCHFSVQKILCRCRRCRVKAKYEEAQGVSLHKAISKEFRGDLKTALQVRQVLYLSGWHAGRANKLVNQPMFREEQPRARACVCACVCLLQVSATNTTARDTFIRVINTKRQRSRCDETGSPPRGTERLLWPSCCGHDCVRFQRTR